ncbi:hypothetical protein GCM10029992_26240 [Glycomyces albus]
MDSIEFSAVGILVNGHSLQQLARRAEFPFAEQEWRENRWAFGPNEGPETLAGDYGPLTSDYYWPSLHFLGEPEEEPDAREDGETMLLTCSCGISGCWALLARIDITADTVRWSGFRNSHRDWDLAALGRFVFSRVEYERALRRTEAA